MSFEKILSNPAVLAFTQENKLTTPTMIQSLVIPDFLQGKSVNVIAKTGSGKTLCFALPITELVKEIEENMGSVDPKSVHGKPLAVVVAPTRELALQIQKVFKTISHHAKMRVRMLGGGEAAKANHILSRSQIDVLIATPGRLASALRKKEIKLEETRYLIIDEADQLLELGFKKDLESIYRACDAELVHVGLFSATHSASLDDFCKTVFTEIDFASYNSEDKNKISQKVKTYNIYLKDDEKHKMTEAFLKNQAKGNGIIFVNKKETVNELQALLAPKFPKTKFHSLHGEMEAKDRKKSYDRFLKEGGVLIATDIAARGLDIDELLWVMNYDLPFEAVYYVHRCGRVGRRQEEGFAYNLVTPRDLNIIGRINEAIKNQSAIKLTSFDEQKFSKVKAIKAKAVSTKLDKKKKQLESLQEKVFSKKKEKIKKFAETVKFVTTPRYKREEEAKTGKKKVLSKKEANNESVNHGRRPNAGKNTKSVKTSGVAARPAPKSGEKFSKKPTKKGITRTATGKVYKKTAVRKAR